MRKTYGLSAVCACLVVLVPAVLGEEAATRLVRIEPAAGHTVYSARFLPLQWENDIRRVQVLIEAPYKCVGKTISLTLTGQADDGTETTFQALVKVRRYRRQSVDIELPAPLPPCVDWVVRVDGLDTVPIVRRIALTDEPARPAVRPRRRGLRRRPPIIVPLQVRVLRVATEPVSPIEVMPGQSFRPQPVQVRQPTAPQVQSPTVTIPRPNPVNPVNPVVRPTVPRAPAVPNIRTPVTTRR